VAQLPGALNYNTETVEFEKHFNYYKKRFQTQNNHTHHRKSVKLILHSSLRSESKK